MYSEMQSLISFLESSERNYDIQKILKAYDYSDSLHEGQFRLSGEPYISHPVAVARIVAELGLDTDSICAALLHDTVEDCADKTSLETLAKMFGNDVAVIVDGVTSTYIHGGGMAGVIVKFEADEAVAAKPEFAEFAKNICLQIAAGTPPTYVNREDVPASVLAEEKEILMAQIKNDEKNANKPEQIIAKMVEGRIGKFYERACLNEQLYVKDDSMTVGKYVASAAKELGGELSINSFVLFEKGEGLEKREDDFAEEIAKLTGKA